MIAASVVAEILGPDLLILLLIVGLLFGGSRLPKLARSIGSAKAEFESGLAGTVGRNRDEAAPDDQRVTMTKAELDAILSERDARAPDDGRLSSPGPPPLLP